MIWVDYGLIAVILVSALVGLLRGFVRELLGLMTWVFAFALAWFAAPWMNEALTPHIETPSIRKAAAYGSLFLGALLVGGVITALISGSVRKSALASADRTMGAGLGLIRGLVICGLFVLIGSHTMLRQDPWWHRSALIPRLQWVADGLATVIPAGWLDAIKSESKVQPESPLSPKPGT